MRSIIPPHRQAASFTSKTTTLTSTHLPHRTTTPPPTSHMPKHTYPHTYPPRKRLHLHKTHLLDLPDDILIRIVSLLQPSLHTLSGRAITHPPAAFALSQTCKRLHAAFLETIIPQLQHIDAAPRNRFQSLHHQPLANHPHHIAALINAYGPGLTVLRLPRYHHPVDPTPVIASLANVCTQLELLAFADDTRLQFPVAEALLENNPSLESVEIYAPGIHLIEALSQFRGHLIKVDLHALKVSVLPAIKTLLQMRGKSIRCLRLGFDHTDFMKTMSTPWKYEPLRPFHDILNYVKENAADHLPSLEKMGVDLGGRSHFADALDLEWFQKLSDHCEVEVHSADGALTIPGKSGVAGVHYVKSLNLGTIFTGPGTYRIGCPNRIDLSNQAFIGKYANGAPIIKERVRSLVKTVVKHSTKSPNLLSVHLGLASVRGMKTVCWTVTDMLTLVPDVNELEISREIVEYASDHMHETKFRKMFVALKNIKLLHLVAVKGIKQSAGVALIDHTTDKYYNRQKRRRFLRSLPEFLRTIACACPHLECILVDDYGVYDGGLRQELEAAMSSVNWLEWKRRGLDIGTIRGLLENWMSTEERIAAGEIVW